MKYVGLAYEEERVLNALSNEEWLILRRETLEYVEELRRAGTLLAAEPLKSVRTAATVRIRGGKTVITDGPFTETKETLGGFFVFEAKSLDEAIKIASRWPSARIGSIEVRPLEEGLNQERRYT